MVICLERGADLHMAQLMPLPLTVSCFSKIQIGLTFLVPAHPGSPGKRAVKRVCVCVGTCKSRYRLSVLLMYMLMMLSDQDGGRIVMRNPGDGRLELRVRNLVPSDMSNYTCLSVNKAGSHEKNGTITVNCE